MRTIKKYVATSIGALKHLNLFETYSNDRKTINREILSTRFYLVLLPLALMIIFIYAAQKELYYTVQIINPTLDNYRHLYDEHSDTLQCPCSKLSVPYSSFLMLTPTLHSVCSSGFISDQWIDILYYENATSYTPADIRSVGHTQWQLLRSLCQLSKQAIDNAFQATFMSTNLIDSRGMLLPVGLVRQQVDALVHDFVSNLNSDHRRQRALFTNFFDRNFLLSGLQTSARVIMNSLLTLNVEIQRYINSIEIDNGMTSLFTCSCDATYECTSPLAIWDDGFTIDFTTDIGLSTSKYLPLQFVDGFKSGCSLFTALLSSTLECFYNQYCINNITHYLMNRNMSFIALDQHVQNQSILVASLGTILDHLMVQSWKMQINYVQYFNTCRSQSCSYTYTQRLNVIYILATLLGLLSGLIKTFRMVCPFLTDILYFIKKPHSATNINQNNLPFRRRISQWFILLQNRLISLNFFKKRESDMIQLRHQILTTRLYIGSLVGLTMILVSITALEPRIVTTTLSTPSVKQYEELYQSGKIPQSCPCSQIAIHRFNFMTLTPLFHQVCSSALISDDWVDRLSYTSDTRSKYYYLDIRSYGLDMFHTIRSFCSLANETTNDAIYNFLSAYWIGNRVLPREQFYQQIEALSIDFQSNLKHNFKQSSSITHEILQGNQVLSSRVSNFFFDGLFNDTNHLTQVRTHIGIKLSTNDTLPTCSCALSTCSQQLGFFRFNESTQNFILINIVPGMFSACYPLDALRVSTLECWFNESCIDIVFSNLNPFPVEMHFDSLNISMLISYSTTTNIGDIIDNLMIEQLLNQTYYEKYYNSCKPLICTYTSITRFDLVYIITTFMSVFGGLSVCLRLICPLMIKTFTRWRQNKVINHTNISIAKETPVRRNWISRLKSLILNLNLFDSESPYGHIQKRERFTTYLYLMLFITIICVIAIYLLFVGYTRTVIVAAPPSNVVFELQKKYTTTLSCPCTQTAISYSTFISLKVGQYHPICSSSFLKEDYLRLLMSDNLTVIPESLLFKRQFLGSQLNLLASLCNLTEQALNHSITLFLRQQFVNIQVLTFNQFYEQINDSVNRLYLDLSLSIGYSVDYLQSMLHGNAIMSSYLSNWQFDPGSMINSSKIPTKSVWYGNCSCARSSQCLLAMEIDNRTFPGLFIGCLPSSVLFQSTLECFYDQTCIAALHTAFFNTTLITLRSDPVNLSSRFLSNTTIGSILDTLFVENWIRHYDYEAFFQACTVTTCNYMYTKKPDFAYILTTLVGLIGGLNIILRLLCPLIILAYSSLIRKILRKDIPVIQIREISTPPPPPVVEQQTNDSIHCHMHHQRWKCTWRSKMILIICLITSVIIVIVVVVRMSFTQVSREMSTSTIEYPQNNLTASSTTLCSSRARWKSVAVTVAGFSNGTASASLAGLKNPNDLFVDSIGNMYITDSLNNRIVYWPLNSETGLLVARGDELDLDTNPMTMPTFFTVFDGYIYLSDIMRGQIRSFSLTNTTSSPNITTIFDRSLIEDNRLNPFSPFGLAYHKTQALLYVCDSLNQRLIILNRTENHTGLVADIELFMENSSIVISPMYIVIDEKADFFYVTDTGLKSVFKFKTGTGIGQLVAGNLMSDSITNQLAAPLGLTLDNSGYLYIVDLEQNRIVQLLNDQGDLRTIAGVGFFGVTPTRLSMPSTIAFDARHNLYVVDAANNRVQRFDLLNNGC